MKRFTKMSEGITIKGTPYAEEELAELLGIDSLDSLSQSELEALLDEANGGISRQLSEFIAATVIASALALINTRSPGVRYFVPHQRYFRGRTPVSRQRINQLIAAHRRQASQRTVRHARDLLNNRISLRQYHQRMARDIVNGHIRMMELGAGGRKQMTAGHWRRLREQLYGNGPGRGDLSRLRQHVERIRLGELSDAQIRDRSRRYGANTTPSYNIGRQENLSQGRWVGRRFLDPAARHCPQCPNYEQLDWVPASEIVAVGDACDCRGNCHCRTDFRLVRDGFNTLNFSQAISG